MLHMATDFSTLSPNFTMDNGIDGPGRVERTATGFTTTIMLDGQPDIKFSINRGVDAEEEAYVEIDVLSMDSVLEKRLMVSVESAIASQKMLADKISQRSNSKIRIYTMMMGKVLGALLKNPIQPEAAEAPIRALVNFAIDNGRTGYVPACDTREVLVDSLAHSFMMGEARRA